MSQLDSFHWLPAGLYLKAFLDYVTVSFCLKAAKFVSRAAGCLRGAGGGPTGCLRGALPVASEALGEALPVASEAPTVVCLRGTLPGALTVHEQALCRLAGGRLAACRAPTADCQRCGAVAGLPP